MRLHQRSSADRVPILLHIPQLLCRYLGQVSYEQHQLPAVADHRVTASQALGNLRDQ